MTQETIKESVERIENAGGTVYVREELGKSFADRYSKVGDLFYEHFKHHWKLGNFSTKPGWMSQNLYDELIKKFEAEK